MWSLFSWQFAGFTPFLYFLFFPIFLETSYISYILTENGLFSYIFLYFLWNSPAYVQDARCNRRCVAYFCFGPSNNHLISQPTGYPVTSILVVTHTDFCALPA